MSAFIGTMCAMKIKPGPAFLGTVSGAVIGVVMAAITFNIKPPTPPQHAVCLQSHREVVMIPTICGAHDICQKPIVTEVCDRIQAPPPRPMCQGSDN